MKLGTETGSLVNHIYAGSKQPTPEVGMGATICHWSDRSAGTVIRIFTIGKDLAIEVQGDHAKRIDNNGMSDCQTYEYSPNPNGGIGTWRFRKGRWEGVRFNRDTNRWAKNGEKGLSLGHRDYYHDFSF
jgi:hypothetical protein